ncbi:MAG: tetratricopeptide repeat protein, partial [Desulfomonile sp.]
QIDGGTSYHFTRANARWYNSDASHFLGYMYAVGDGVTEDYDESLRWHRISADQGGAWSQLCLGNMYYEGDGAAQDYAEAAKWYRLAGEQGLADAQYNLAVMYYYGDGVKQDYAEAAKWYRLAAKQGHVEAITLLEGVIFHILWTEKG